jgi:predicted MFS family arabinose efflux permease
LGRVGDLWGRRRLFAAGLVVFAAASLIGGFAAEPWVLVTARLLQGAAAAAFVPAALSLLTTAFPAGAERNRAVGTYGAMAALGFIIGMVGGGVLTQLLGWRWVMFVNVPVAIAALLLVPAAVAESRDEHASSTVDLRGALPLTGGLAGLLYAMSAVPATGLASSPTLGSAAAGVVLLVLFAILERRAPTPLVPLQIFTTRRAVAPNASILLLSMVGVAWLYVLTLYFQDVLGHGPLRAGLLFLPMTLASVVAAAAAGRLVTRLGPRPTAAAGLLLVILGLSLMTRLSAPNALGYVLAGMVIGEAGFMLANVSAHHCREQWNRRGQPRPLGGSAQHFHPAGQRCRPRCRRLGGRRVYGVPVGPPQRGHRCTRGGPAGRTAGVRQLRGGRPNRRPLRATLPATELNTR